MSAIIGRPPSAVTHELNPYIPDILRPPSISSRHSRTIDESSPARYNTLSTLECSTERVHFLAQRSSQAHGLVDTASPPLPVCARCQNVIQDQYLYNIQGQTWHEACAICHTCSTPLNDVCFLFEGHLYCRRDYDRLHATKCVNCRQPMRSHELFMRARHPDDPPDAPCGLFFHVSCFTCAVCQQPIAAGEKYLIDYQSHRPICQADFLTVQHHVPLAQQCPSNLPAPPEDTLEAGEPTIPPVNSATGRRIRTSLTDEQRQHLQKSYELNSRPPKHVRELLAKELSVPVRVVQVWFQNQRARDKRNGLVRPTVQAPADPPVPGNSRSHPPHSPNGVMMTPSPRTSVESGPLLDFSGFSCENPDPLLSSLNDTLSQPWMPAADNLWFTEPAATPTSTHHGS